MSSALRRKLSGRRSALFAGVGVVAVILAFLGASHSAPLGEQPLTWGPIQSRTIDQVVFEWLMFPDNTRVVLGFHDPSGAVASITTDHDCGYRVGDTVQYRISSMDYALGTQRSQLVNGPAGCEAVPNGT